MRFSFKCKWGVVIVSHFSLIDFLKIIFLILGLWTQESVFHWFTHNKTFRTVSRFKTDSRSPAVHLPFERTGTPFERVELSVLKNSSSVQTVRAIRSRKLISRSNGSSYPFEKNHQPFEQLELSVREIFQPFEWLKLSVREIHQPFERLELSVQERNNEFFWQPFQQDKTSKQIAMLC